MGESLTRGGKARCRQGSAGGWRAARDLLRIVKISGDIFPWTLRGTLSVHSNVLKYRFFFYLT